ncbi:MAG: hypothetical protein IJT02_06635 [Synergistaceae bacterium]|nr:hypothetical protein [Synergistaceae bacterium]
MFNDEPFATAKGVILNRAPTGETNLWVTFFLEGEGIVSLSSKNMMGDSEPFVWGYFELKKKQKSASYHVFEADIRDDMLHLRRSRAALSAVFGWVKYLLRYLPHGQPDDELLNNLYWSMKLLTVSAVPEEAADWRFVWLWLREWGIAPELTEFYASRGFNAHETELLSRLEVLAPKEVVSLFSSPLNPSIRENVFKVASSLAVGFLNET